MLYRSLGQLQPLLDADRKRREVLAAEQARHLETLGLSNATRQSFAFLYVTSTIPCGEVYVVRHHTTNALYTLRQEVKDRMSEADERSRLLRELACLRAVNEASTQCSGLLPSLLRAFETGSDTSFLRGSGSVYLLFQQHVVTDLATLIEDEPLSEAKALFAGASVAQALDVLHREAKVIYRNLAPDTVHVLGDGNVCLMDFRFARRDDGSCRTICGPVGALAPEMVRGDVHGYAADWWAMGIFLYELVVGDSPWRAPGTSLETEEDETVIFSRIVSHTAGTLQLSEVSSELLGALVNLLLDPNSETRLGSGGEDGGGAQVKADPWFEDVNWQRLVGSEVPSPFLTATAEMHKELLLSPSPNELLEGVMASEETDPGASYNWLDES